MWSDEQFREEVRQAVATHGSHDVLDADIWDAFARRLHYLSASFDDPAAYNDLHGVLARLQRGTGGLGNRLFYLATAPEFFPLIAEQLGEAGLAAEDDDDASAGS